MNNPKEKAKDLVDKFWDSTWIERTLTTKNDAKRHALICVDEIMVVCLAVNYWQQVKQEIENL